MMTTRVAVAVIAIVSAGSMTFGAMPLRAQEEAKPVPKDSVRVSVSGCSKGRVFTAGPAVGGSPRLGGPRGDAPAHERPEAAHGRDQGL